jgi:N-acyl-D-amino-acid deacylase
MLDGGTAKGLGKISDNEERAGVRPLSNIHPFSGKLGDARINRITIRNLLTHSGGWDANISGEPVIPPLVTQIAAVAGGQFPPAPKSIISWMLDRRLDFDPGTRFAYSNFGFIVLGRIVEEIAGQPYDEFVRRKIPSRKGIKRMHLGGTDLTLRARGGSLLRLPGRSLDGFADATYHRGGLRAI